MLTRVIHVPEPISPFASSITVTVQLLTDRAAVPDLENVNKVVLPLNQKEQDWIGNRVRLGQALKIFAPWRILADHILIRAFWLEISEEQQPISYDHLCLPTQAPENKKETNNIVYELRDISYLDQTGDLVVINDSICNLANDRHGQSEFEHDRKRDFIPLARFNLLLQGRIRLAHLLISRDGICVLLGVTKEQMCLFSLYRMERMPHELTTSNLSS
ncbi:hypothetical protein Ciccas_003861 [Cichlidogyrus casuarinus]|uniref:Uncharacterized protein n=1 Tax=Cichlidogyrus casuarinus TaxID=1844966 RepID=A0ABD2QE21_9PLAT